MENKAFTSPHYLLNIIHKIVNSERWKWQWWTKCLWKHDHHVFEKFIDYNVREYIYGRYMISKDERQSRLFSAMSSKVSSKESRIQKETLVKEEFTRFSLWSTADKWTQYSRPKEIASSMEVNIPSSIRSIRYCVHRACMYILYWGAHDTRS